MQAAGDAPRSHPRGYAPRPPPSPYIYHVYTCVYEFRITFEFSGCIENKSHCKAAFRRQLPLVESHHGLQNQDSAVNVSAEM